MHKISKYYQTLPDNSNTLHKITQNNTKTITNIRKTQENIHKISKYYQTLPDNSNTLHKITQNITKTITNIRKNIGKHTQNFQILPNITR